MGFVPKSALALKSARCRDAVDIVDIIRADVVKVIPVDVGVPDVGLGVGDGAGPAFAGAEAFAGAQAFGVFLPGDDEASAWGRGDVDAVGVTTAGGQTFGGAPGDVVNRIADTVEQWCPSSSSRSCSSVPRAAQTQP